MSERKPTDDLKEGLGLLFRAARGLAKEATPEAAEKVVGDGAKELVRIVNDVGRAIGSELEKSFGGGAAEAKPGHEASAAPSEAPPAAADGDGGQKAEPGASKPEKPPA